MDSLSAAGMKQKIGGDVVATLGGFLLNIGKQTGLWEVFRGCGRYTTAELAASLSVAQLLERNYCPPWWVASQQVAGSCRAIK